MTMNPDAAHWMGEALKLAEQAKAIHEVPVGALLVKDGRILGRGMNLRETLGRTASHAELMALEDYNRQSGQWRLPPDTTLIVTVEPCLMCTGALIWARVDHVVYGCADPRNAGLRSLADRIEAGHFDHRFVSVQGGVREEEAGALISSFFRERRVRARELKQGDSEASPPT